MKKALATVVVMGLAAAPLMAAPAYMIDPANTHALPLDQVDSSRSPTGYVNGAETYDAMGNNAGGQNVISASFTLGPTTWLFEDVTLPSSQAGSLGGMHFVFINPGATTAGVATHSFIFMTNPGGAGTAIGATILNSTGAGSFGALFGTGAALGTVNFTGAGIFLPQTFWVGLRVSVTTGHQIGAGPVQSGSSTTALGTGFGTFGVGPSAPFVTGTAFTIPSGFGSGGVVSMAMDFVPEPAAACLLGLGGLVALRRRRAA